MYVFDLDFEAVGDMISEWLAKGAKEASEERALGIW